MSLWLSCIFGFVAPALIIPKHATLKLLSNVAAVHINQETKGKYKKYCVEHLSHDTFYDPSVQTFLKQERQMQDHYVVLSDINPAAVWGALWIATAWKIPTITPAPLWSRLAPLYLVAVLFPSLSVSTSILGFGMCFVPHLVAPVAVCRGVHEQFMRYKRIKTIGESVIAHHAMRIHAQQRSVKNTQISLRCLLGGE